MIECFEFPNYSFCLLNYADFLKKVEIKSSCYSLCIIVCRPLIYHTLLYDAGPTVASERLWYTLLFMMIAVCAYKDVPDTKGDQEVDHIKTLPMIIGRNSCCFIALWCCIYCITQIGMVWIQIAAFLLVIRFCVHHKKHDYLMAYQQIWNLFYVMNLSSIFF